MEIIRRNPLVASQRAAEALGRIRSRMSTLEEQATSGVKFDKPSEAAGEWTAIHALRATRADQDVYDRNISRIRDMIDAQDTALGSTATVIKRAIERAVQMGSGTYSDADRIRTAGEAAQLREEILALANSRLDGKAIFAGDAWDGVAFDPAGVYQGAAATSKVQVAQDQSIQMMTDGSAAFQGTTDVFQALSDFETALASGSAAAVQTSLGALQGAYRQVVEARQEVGFRQMRVIDAEVIGDSLSGLLDERIAATLEADPIDVFTELSALRTSYEAALQVTAASSGAKLFDFLR